MTFAEVDALVEELRDCRYCDQFTGNDETGCAGRPRACRHFRVDPITTPKRLMVVANIANGDRD